MARFQKYDRILEEIIECRYDILEEIKECRDEIKALRKFIFQCTCEIAPHDFQLVGIVDGAARQILGRFECSICRIKKVRPLTKEELTAAKKLNLQFLPK